MSKYFIPATATDPECPTAEGSALIDKRDALVEAIEHLGAAKTLLANLNDIDPHYYNLLVAVMEYLQQEHNTTAEELLQP